MRIVIVGCGYVGLVSGTCFAQIGHDVICVDKDAGLIAALAAGNIPIYEKGLRALVAANVAEGRLSFAPALPPLGETVDAVFIAVGTPASADGPGADLTALASAVEDIAQAASAPLLVVVKSTVPLGVCDAVEAVLHDLRPDIRAEVVSNPEFLKEGSAVLDFMTPDRIVVGTRDANVHPVLEALYAPIVSTGVPIVWTTRRSSELIKHASNAFLATKIAFINEIADLCERGGADVREVAHGMGLDTRIGTAFLQPGPGYGGSCFPKDSVALLDTAERFGVTLNVLQNVVTSNFERRESLVGRVSAALDGDLSGKRIALLGLTFKPGTDDCRESPALGLARDLMAAGATVVACDPKGIPPASPDFAGMTLALNAYDCARGSDCLVLVTDWPQFRTLDPDRIGAVMSRRSVVDLRNALDPEAWNEAGFDVQGIGRAPDRATAPQHMEPHMPPPAESHPVAVAY